ncbi:MAG: hypothetical protein ACFFAN_18160 [Promethearchaeota archaeon]
MRNKILYIYTEDLSFFYKLNKELNRRKITFKILNIGNKIPTFPSLILTTSKEVEKVENLNEKILIFPYKGENFEKYILKVVAAYQISYKDNYSNLTFSIDPGTKHIGLIIFLDGYYLESHTFYEKTELINKIKDYVDFLQEDNINLINLNFKFGRGVLLITMNLINRIYKIFKNRKEIKVYLIDEAKSSKVKIHNKERKFPKDEASALILALRDGIEVNQNNYYKVFNQIKSKKLKKEEAYKIENIENSNEIIIKLGEIAEKVLNRELSLSESTEMIKDFKLHKYENL